MRCFAGTGTIALALAAACGRSGGTSDKDLAGLVVTETPVEVSVDVAAAAHDPAELGRALAQSWSRAGAALGDHQVRVDSTSEVRAGQTVLDALTDTTTIDSAKDGSYHAVYDNSADYGREVVWLGGKLYQRPRYAKWHLRAPETPDEPAQIRDQMAGVLAADFDLIASAAELSDRGSITEAGRPAHKIDVKLSPSPHAPPKQAVSQKAWRERATVQAVSGQIVLDDATGLALRASLDATVGFVRDGQPLTMHVTVQQAVSAIAPAIAAPADDQVVATPERLPEVDERNAILDHIAPPIGKAANDPNAPAAEAPGSGSGTGTGSGSSGGGTP